MVLESVYEGLYNLFWDHFPLPILLACVLVMLAPALLFRWPGSAPFLESEKWKQLALTKKTVVNHNTRIFRSALLCQSSQWSITVLPHACIPRCLTEDKTGSLQL